jgi:hypothetical protein
MMRKRRAADGTLQASPATSGGDTGSRDHKALSRKEQRDIAASIKRLMGVMTGRRTRNPARAMRQLDVMRMIAKDTGVSVEQRGMMRLEGGGKTCPWANI